MLDNCVTIANGVLRGQRDMKKTGDNDQETMSGAWYPENWKPVTRISNKCCCRAGAKFSFR